MYAQCPECLTVFSLSTDLLTQARGTVLCGHCYLPFDALRSLRDQLPPEPFHQLPAHDPATSAPMLELAVYRPHPDKPKVLEAVPRPPHDAVDTTPVAPRFARKDRRERRWPWVVASLLLLLGLGGQIAWAKRDELIRDATVGPLLREACSTLGCTLPLVRDTKQFSLLARDVQSHPSVPGALLITANLRNDAPFAQPYPVLVITLSDINGKRIAMRRLRASEYLGDNAALEQGLPPGGTAALVLEVEDPGGKAVAFEFGFE